MSKNTETVKNRLFKIREEMEELENILEWNEGCEYCNGLNQDLGHEIRMSHYLEALSEYCSLDFINGNFILKDEHNRVGNLNFEYCPYCGRKLNV